MNTITVHRRPIVLAAQLSCSNIVYHANFAKKIIFKYISETGQISALKSFEDETLKTFQFQVVATDSESLRLRIFHVT